MFLRGRSRALLTISPVHVDQSYFGATLVRDSKLEELPKEEVSSADVYSRTIDLLTMPTYVAGGEAETRPLGY